MMKAIKEFLFASDKSVLSLDYALRRKWRIKSKYQNILLLLLPVCFFVGFNLLNYLYASVFQYTLPPVDIVNTLATFNNIPNYSYDQVFDRTFWYDNSLLLGTLRSIYLTNEESYLKSHGECTIAVEPRIVWGAKSVALNLNEGLFNFTNGILQLNETSLSHSISKGMPRVNYFDFRRPSKLDELVQNFIRQYLYTIFYSAAIPPSFYDVDSLVYPFYIARVANLGILILNITTLLSMVALEVHKFCSLRWKAHIFNYVICVVSLVSSLAFLFMKFSVFIFVGVRFPSTRNHLVNFIHIIQILFTLGLCYFNFKSFSRMTAGIKEEKSMKKLLSSFQPSPDQLYQASSVYSLMPEKEDADKRDVSGLSLDPMRQPTSVEINLEHMEEKQAIEEPMNELLNEQPINSSEKKETKGQPKNTKQRDTKQVEVNEPANATNEQLIETSEMTSDTSKKSKDISQKPKDISQKPNISQEQNDISQKPIPNHYDRPTAYSQASVFREEASS